MSTISPGLRQIFESPFTINVGQKEIIKMKSIGVITDRDLKTSKFLFEFRFATAAQIHEYLNTLETEENQSSLSAIKSRLDKLVSYRVLNKFMLTDDATLTKIKPDALEIYCLDIGGRYLLANYSNEDTIDWYTAVNQVTSEIVSRNLASTSFFLSLMRTAGEYVEYFRVEPILRVGKKSIIPSFEFCFNVKGNKSYFIGEVVREYDFPVHFREKAYKLESLMESNAWKKYYYDATGAPVLFIVTDSDDLALETAQLITETTEMRRFRITTDERMERPLSETGAFLKYNDEQVSLQEITATTFLV